MSTSTGHLIESAGGVSLAEAGESAQGADVKSMPVSVNGLSAELLEELAALAVERTAEGGLRLMGEGGILPELAQHLMQAALEAEMDQHLAAEAGQVGGRGARSGGNTRNGYRAKKVITEVGPVTVQVPRDRLGTFSPRLLPKYARRTGALDEMVLSLTAKGLTSGEIVLQRQPHGGRARRRGWCSPHGSAKAPRRPQGGVLRAGAYGNAPDAGSRKTASQRGCPPEGSSQGLPGCRGRIPAPSGAGGPRGRRPHPAEIHRPGPNPSGSVVPLRPSHD